MVRKWESRPCLSHMPCGSTGEGKMPSLDPHHLLQVSNMTPPLISCSRPCVSPVQHNTVDPLDRGTGKPILKVWEAYSWYCLPCLYCCSRAKGKMPTPLTFSTSSWWERWPSPLPATTLEKTGISPDLRRADPIGGGVCDPVSMLWALGSCPHYTSFSLWCCRGRVARQYVSPGIACHRLTDEGADLPTYQLLHSRKQALLVAWATE